MPSYPTLTLCVMAWWPKHKKVCVSVLSSAYGAGAAMYIPVQSMLINPHRLRQQQGAGYSMHSDLMATFPDIFVSMALMSSLLQIIGILCLRDPSDMLNRHRVGGRTLRSISNLTPFLLPQPRSGTFTLYDDKDVNGGGGSSMHDLTVTECLYLWEFWKLFIAVTLHIAVTLFVIVLYQDFTAFYLGIRDPTFLCVLGTLSSAFHGAFRSLFCWIYDRCPSFQKCNGSTSALLSCFVGTLWLSQYGGRWMVTVWMAVLFSLNGSIYGLVHSI